MKTFFYFLLFGYIISTVCKEQSKIPPVSLTQIDSSYAPLKTFAQSLNLIETNFLGKTKRNSLIQGAIQGMLFELDPYSYFMNPQQVDHFHKQNKSQFGGMGIQVAFKNQQIIVMTVFKNSSADKKGVQAGDIITHVNDQPLKNLSYDSALQKMTGKIGDTINLKVKKVNSEKLASLSIQLKKN